MNKTKSIVVASLMLGMGLTACNSGGKHRDPGKTYAPDMVYSRAYDAYTVNPNFADGQTSREPVAGAVARGMELPDHLTEGDTMAYKAFDTDLRFNEMEMQEGQRLNCFTKTHVISKYTAPTNLTEIIKPVIPMFLVRT